MGWEGGQAHRDLKWRAVIVRFYYGIKEDAIAFMIGASEQSVYLWWKLFDRTGDVERQVLSPTCLLQTLRSLSM